MTGILLIDKPSGWTSSDVVAKLRGILHERRIGHSGTLDPLATGLLVVFVGRATRAAEFAESHSKRYVAGLRLGLSTDTQDVTGRELSRSDRAVTAEELTRALESFRGVISQLPPMYSAVKVNGRRLYEIARRGGQAERKPRDITIYSLELTGRDGDDFILDVSCSKGSYIRTLCSDIGDALSCGGCMSSLRRIRAGEFSIDNAHTLAEVQRAADAGEAEKLLLPIDSLFPSAARYTAGAAEEKRLRCGNELKTALPDGEYRVYSAGGEFLALCAAKNGVLKTIKNFFEVQA